MGKLLAGVDVGTTGVRCMLFDLQGTLVCSAYKEYGSTYLLHYDLELDSKGTTRSKDSVSPTLKAS